MVWVRKSVQTAIKAEQQIRRDSVLKPLWETCHPLIKSAEQLQRLTRSEHTYAWLRGKSSSGDSSRLTANDYHAGLSVMLIQMWRTLSNWSSACISSMVQFRSVNRLKDNSSFDQHCDQLWYVKCSDQPECGSKGLSVEVTRLYLWSYFIDSKPHIYQIVLR